MTKKAIATFEISETFKISGQGIIFDGCVLDGTISSGDFIEFSINGFTRIRKIKGISMMRRLDGKLNALGLLISCSNDNEMQELKDWTPNRFAADIFKTDKSD